MQSFGGTPCRALRELRAELWWNSVQGFEGAPCRAWWSSVQSFGGAPCRALRGLRREPLAELCVEALVKLSVELLAKLRAELLAKLLVEPLVELCTELPQSSAWSSTKALHGAPPKLCTELCTKLCTELCTSLCQVYPLYSHLVPFLTLHTSQRTPIKNNLNQYNQSINQINQSL